MPMQYDEITLQSPRSNMSPFSRPAAPTRGMVGSRGNSQSALAHDQHEDHHRHDKTEPDTGFLLQAQALGDDARQLEKAKIDIGSDQQDRKSTRLNSSHVRSSYAVC